MRADAASFAARWRVLVIGVDVAGDAMLPVLRSAERDASGLAGALADPMGCAVPSVNIECLTGPKANRQAIEGAMRRLAADATGDDAILIYFSGHGLARNGRFYLCPADTDIARLDETAVASSLLDEFLGTLDVRGILLVLDCCEGGGFAENAPATFRTLRRGEYRILLSAARAGQQSWELSAGQGTLFSRVLIDIISGRVSTGSTPGAIYFADLMRELYDRIEELRETTAREAPPQDPVYAGAFGKDPLLFVHRDLSLKRLTVETARYSPGYVRRRIQRVALVALLVAFFGATVYYAILYDTQYAALDGSRLAVFTGHPRFNAPGLPIKLWTFDYGADHLIRSAAGAMPLPMIAPLGKPVLPLLDGKLRPEVRAAAALDAGDGPRARAIALTVLSDQAASPESRLFAQLILAQAATASDVVLLKSMLHSERRELRHYAVLALSRLDPAFIFPLLVLDLPDGNRWPHQEIVRDLQPPCSAPMNEYLNAVAGIDSNVPSAEQVADAALRTGCTLSVAALVTAIKRPSLDEGDGLVGYARAIGAVAPLRAALEHILDNSVENVFSRERAIGSYMLLDGGTCRPGFEAALRGRFDFAQLTAARAIGRLCPGYTLKTSFDAARKAITLTLVDRTDHVAWKTELIPGARGSFALVRPAFRELLRSPRDAAIPAIRTLAESGEDDPARQRALEGLQYFEGARVRPNSDMLDSNNLGVRRAAYELERLAAADATVDRLLARVGGGDMFYVELLGRSPLKPAALDRVRAMVHGDANQRRDAACVVAMQGTVNEVAALIVDPDPDLRRNAAECLPYHADAAAILARIERAPRQAFPVDTLSMLRRDVAAKTQLANEFDRLSTAAARLWRLSVIEDEPGAGINRGLRYWIREQRFQLRTQGSASKW